MEILIYVSPNIVGSISSTWSDAMCSGGASVSGAIKAINSTGRVMRWQDGYSGYRGFDFYASRVSSIYGETSTVQPNSIRVSFIIKY